jgi:phage-related protein
MLRRVRREVEETERQVESFNDTSRRMGRDTDRSFGTVTKRLGGLVKVAAKFASIGLGAGLAITQAAQLAAALAPLAGLLAGIPAAVALAGAAFATLKLALSGVGDAFKAALGDDAEKFEESLKGLAPAAQKVARELREIRPQLMAVRNAAQQAFFGPLQGQLRSTAAALSGPLRRGVKGVATEYGLAASSVLAFTREARTASAVTRIFAGTRRVIAGIRPAMTPILQGFRDMAVQGVGTLSRLASGVGSVGQRFGEWMQKFAASGGVQRALEGALVVVKQLGSLLLNVGGILNSIITAAQGGGGLLGFLSQATAQLNAFLKTAAAQQALRSFFQTMNMLGTALAPIVPIIGQLAAAVITALMPVVQAVAPAISQVVGILGQTAAALVPAFAPLGSLLVVVAQGIGQIFAAIGPLLPALATMITQLITGLVPVLTPVVHLIAQTASQIGGALVQALIAMMPSLTQLVLSVSTLLPVWAQLTPLFAQLLVALLPLAPPLTQIATILATLLVPVLRLAIQILVKYWSVIIGLIVPVVRLLATVFTWVARVLQVAVTAIGAGAMWLWNNAIKPAWEGIKAAIDTAWGFIRPIFNVLASVLKGVLGVAFLVLWNTVKIAWIGIQIAIKVAWAIIKPIWNLIKGFLAKTLGPQFQVFKKIAGDAWQGLRIVIDSVWRTGIRPAFNAVKRAVDDVRKGFSVAVAGIKKIWSGLKSAAKTPVNFVIGLYNDGIVSLVNKLAGFAGVKDRLGKIPLLARGGTLDNPASMRPMMTNGPMAIVGEGRRQHPEYVIPTDPRFRGRAQALWAAAGSDLGAPIDRKWLTGKNRLGGEGIAFERGGSLQTLAFGGIIGKFVDGVRNFTIGNVSKGAKILLDKVLGAAVPGSGVFRNVVAAIPGWIKNTLLGWIKNKVASFGGGPGFQRGLAWAKTQDGKPYQWGGNGNPSWDCSGFMSAIESVIRGQKPHRRWSTHPFHSGARNPMPGWYRNQRSGFMIGVTGAGVGHTAGTLLGKNVESSGSGGVRVGGGARGFNNSMFPHRYGLKFDQGGMLPRGWSAVYNGLRQPEPVFPSLEAAAAYGGAGGGPLVSIDRVEVTEAADVDMLASRLGFAIRAVTL